MFTVSKYFLCETPAWKHLNLIALHVCLYQKSYAQITSIALSVLEKAAGRSHVTQLRALPACGSQHSTLMALASESAAPSARSALSPHLCTPLLCLTHCCPLLSEDVLDFLPQPASQVFSMYLHDIQCLYVL